MFRTLLFFVIVASQILTLFSTNINTLSITPVGSNEIFENKYYFRGDSRDWKAIFISGFEINKIKKGPKNTEAFGSGPEYLSMSASFMGAAGFPFLNDGNRANQLEDESYVYVISKKVHENYDSSILNFMDHSIQTKLQDEQLQNYDFKDWQGNLTPTWDKGIVFHPVKVAMRWGIILRHYWPKEVVIKEGRIDSKYIVGALKVSRIRSPFSDSANLISIKTYIANPRAQEVIDPNILAQIKESVWFLNLAMFNAVHFFETTIEFYVEMLVAERNHKKERNSKSITEALNNVENHWLERFKKGEGYNLLEKSPLGLEALRQ